MSSSMESNLAGGHQSQRTRARLDCTAAVRAAKRGMGEFQDVNAWRIPCGWNVLLLVQYWPQMVEVVKEMQMHT